MRNVFFVFLLALGFMSFTSVSEVETDLSFTNSIEIERLAEENVPCRWRTCTYINGVRQGCTEWTYGECDKDGNGKLTPIR